MCFFCILVSYKNLLWRWRTELKQQRKRWQRKRHLKSYVALLPTLSRSFHLVQFVKCWHFFLKLNSERLYRSSGKENKVVVFCSRRSRAVTAKKCTKKRDAHAELLFCQFANLKLLLSCPSLCCRRRRCVSSLIFLCLRFMSRLSPSAYKIASPMFKLMLASLVRSKL